MMKIAFFHIGFGGHNIRASSTLDTGRKRHIFCIWQILDGRSVV